MKSRLKNLTFLIASVYLLQVLGLNAATAQIVPAADGTGTLVAPDGNRIDIGGGTLSADQANLFHSFTKFGLDQSQIANFLSQPNIENILARVVGGDPSIINGLLQVTGGNSNLYLLNPAGVIFGNSASLNVPASFVATTANGIGFNGGWFGTTGTDYAALGGNPTGFSYPTAQPGAIINAGTLAVPTGESLALVGGTVVNTGTLSAPGGTVTALSVPGQSLVRLSQPGSLLSLEIQPSSGEGFTALSLPALLTGPGAGQVTGLRVASNGDVVLSSSGERINTQPGTTTIAGAVNVANSQSGSGGTAHILGRQVALISTATVDASGATGGGTVLVGGDFQGKGTVPNAENTVVGPSTTLKADAGISGNGGTAIVWSDGSTRYYGTITARGGAASGNGGFVEVSGKNWLSFQGGVDVSAVNGALGTLLLDPANITIGTIADLNGDGTPGDDVIGSINATDFPGANSFITAAALNGLLVGANVSIGATNSINVNADVSVPTARTLTLDAPTINLNASILPANASSILVGTAGTVNINTTTAPLQSGVDLVASGGTVNVTVGGIYDNTVATIRKPLSLIATNGVTFTRTSGIQIGDAGVPTLSNVTVRGFGFDNTTGGIAIFGGTATTNVTIANNTFTNYSAAAANPPVFSFGPTQTGLTITGNTFNGTGAASPAIRLDNITGSTISGNTITGYPRGIQLDGATNTTVSSNTISNATLLGIQLASVVGPTTNVQVTANTLNNVGAGVVLFNNNMGGPGAQQIVVSNNFINTAQVGVAFRDAGGTLAPDNYRITSNAFNGITNSAVYTSNNAPPATGVLDLTGNWWGSPTGPTLGTGPSGIAGNFPNSPTTPTNIATSPYAFSGTDAAPTVAGFQPRDLQVGSSGTFPNVCLGTGLTCIQRAINLATPFTLTNINVLAGDYTANATTTNLTIPIERVVNLRGPNAAVAGIGTRAAEARILTTAAVPASILISGNGSTIAGFTVDGGNTAQFGIGNGAPATNTTLQNNIIRNTTRAGIGMGAAGGPGLSTGSVISGNLVQNPGTLGGIVVTDNFYANITNNVVQQADIGIRMERFRVAGTPITISGNTVTSNRFGILVNSLFQDASAVAINNNVVQTGAAATGTNIGIGLLSIQDRAVVSLSDNNVTGGLTGILAFNNTATTPVTVTGGTLSGSQTGVRLYNLEPSLPAASQNATAPSTLILDRVTVQNPTTTGLVVQDNSPVANNGVTLIVRNGSTITGGQTGLRAEGTEAFVQFPGGPPSASFSGQTGDFITLVSNPNDIDARTVQFNGVTGAQAVAAGGTTLADIQAKITDRNDNPALGLVLLFTPTAVTPVQPQEPARPSQEQLYRFLVDFEGRVIVFRPFTLLNVTDVLCRQSGFLPDTDDDDEDELPTCIENQEGFKVPKKLRGRKTGYHYYYRPNN
ncbi:MAG: right-handed parallel beta-helix repeat-containing protein [Leptolyngbyaceae cyanobacterium bins.59]|nr:right-handed parallel beta-helix repeat-containing protein [Leptolyngbyaceae cyanobacterium bins.59]